MKKRLECWDDILKMEKSDFFYSKASDINDKFENGAIGERLMYIQSNAHVLIGQDPSGKFSFIAMPKSIFPTPVGEEDLGFGAGMYYQSDMVVFLGGLSYEFYPEDGGDPVIFANSLADNRTYYAGHFLPVTYGSAEYIEACITTFSPVAVKVEAAPLFPAPLPGPSGAFYILILKNKGKTRIKGKIRLCVNDDLTAYYTFPREHVEPSFHELLRDTLILWKPEGCVAIHLKTGKWIGYPGQLFAELDVDIEPGGSMVVETRIAICGEHNSIMSSMFGMFMYTPLEWLNATADFWESRLGRLKVGSTDSDKKVKISRDIYIRCLIDNFNCLQGDAKGNITVHWQGAPSHICGLTWGIDVEPTAVSVMQFCPEIARQVLLFFIDRSRAPRSKYDKCEHSTPILVAPLIIAGKLLKMTGDIAFFHNNPGLMQSLEHIVNDLLRLKASSCTLFPSRFSSDGRVNRRYDHGTNVKIWYAFSSYAYLMEKLERMEEAEKYRQICREIVDGIDKKMVREGPFGFQISGGTNLGEDYGDFYIEEDVPYYDGEDSASALAPVYGIYDYSYIPWINYHRYARSLFCSNFDPEFQTLRWFPWGGPIDGTAFFSGLGGCISKSEMLESLDVLIKNACDEFTGSVFWWPYGKDYKRGLARCSQGQGAWAWQYLQQWLGLNVDACERVLVLSPRGLPTMVDWEGAVLGKCRFDIHWTENQNETVYRIRNLNQEKWTIKAGIRRYNTAAEGNVWFKNYGIKPGEELLIRGKAGSCIPKGSKASLKVSVPEKEAKILGGEDSIVFDYYGCTPLASSTSCFSWCWEKKTIDGVLIRLVIGNYTSLDWTSAIVRFICPEKWGAAVKAPGLYVIPEEYVSNIAIADLGTIASGNKAVAPFWVKIPSGYAVSQPRYSCNPFDVFTSENKKYRGLVFEKAEAFTSTSEKFIAKLVALDRHGNEITKKVEIPVSFTDKKKAGI